MQEKKQRIWELDALRGICILCVVCIHFLFDLVYFVGLDISFPPGYVFIQQYGGVIFVLLSGICATLGSRSVRRGCVVFGCGMLITLVTWIMYRLGMAGSDVVIKFGVLHLLGICMLVYPLYRKLPTWAIAALGAVLISLGYWFMTFTVEARWLFPLGLLYHGFESGDYFPLCPQLGWFMMGTVLGRTLYAKKVSLLPERLGDFFLFRFFRFCGRQSLWIFLLHQPVVYGLIELILALR